MMDNREIYNRNYSEANLTHDPKTRYDRWMIDFRFRQIERFGAGKDVLDLCCGTGAYLLPVLDKLQSAVGVDFSSNMLSIFRGKLAGRPAQNLNLIEADATQIPLRDGTFDFVFSLTSLYYVPNVARAVGEISRVLRPGGRALIELGNRTSINTWLSDYYYKHHGWAKLFAIPCDEMLAAFAEAGLAVKEWHVFQLLPMVASPRRMFYLFPILAPQWKTIMGIRIGDKLLDEKISGAVWLRRYAFRHLFVLEKI
jgi:ubiquinone/menaquinone biosynthesis C-methylase UbiE